MTLHRPSAVIFDLDGTLVDSHGSIRASIRAVVERHALAAPTPEALEVAVSLPLRSMLARIADTQDEALVEAYAQTYLEHYVATMVEASHPFAGIAEALDALDARRIPIAVLTNKTEINAKKICDGRFGIDRFATLVGSVPERANKPDPVGALLAASRLSVSPRDCWLVGDSRIDVDTARASGMAAIGAGWGIPAELVEKIADADRLLDVPASLIALVDALPS